MERLIWLRTQQWSMACRYCVFVSLLILQQTTTEKWESRFSVPLLENENCSKDSWCGTCHQRCLGRHFCDFTYGTDCQYCVSCFFRCAPEAGCVFPQSDWSFPVGSVTVKVAVADIYDIFTRSFTAKLKVTQTVNVDQFQYGYIQNHFGNILDYYHQGFVEVIHTWPDELHAEASKEPYKNILAPPEDPEDDETAGTVALQFRDDPTIPMEPVLASLFFRRYGFDFETSIDKGYGTRRVTMYGMFVGHRPIAFLDNLTISWGDDEALTFPFILRPEKFPFDEQIMTIHIYLPFVPGVESFGGNTVPSASFILTREEPDFPGLSSAAIATWPSAWDVVKTESETKEWEGQYRLSLHITVRRKATYMFVRYFIPLWMLAGSSVTAFFVKPEQAMPRFAAVYVAFLSLQGFRMYSKQLVPGGSTVTWIDALDFYAASFGIICIIANTISQVTLERFSPLVAYRFDQVCRFFLLSTYVCAQILLFLLMEMDPLQLIALVAGWTGLVLVILAIVLLLARRDVHLIVLRHYALDEKHVDLDHREARLIFRRLDADRSGTVSAFEVLLSIRAALGRTRCPLSDDELLALAVDLAEELGGKEHMQMDEFVKGHRTILRAVSSRLKTAMGCKEKADGIPVEPEEMEVFKEHDSLGREGYDWTPDMFENTLCPQEPPPEAIHGSRHPSTETELRKSASI